MVKKQTKKLLVPSLHIRRLSSPVVFLFIFFCFLCRSREKAFEIFAALPWPFYFFKLVFYPESAPSFKVISSSALLRQHSALKWIWIVVTECLRQFKRVSQRLGDLQLQQSRVVADLHWVDTFCRDGTLGSLMAWPVEQGGNRERTWVQLWGEWLSRVKTKKVSEGQLWFETDLPLNHPTQ